MDFVPHQVSSALYSGISGQIEYCKKADIGGYWSDYYAHCYLSIAITISWYKEHCVVSSVYIQKEYDELTEQIKGKYFLYDYFQHYKYTLVNHTIGGTYTESQNRLLPRDSLPREDIVVGKVIKVDGLYVEITEVYKNALEENRGSFKAETLTVDKLIKMRKGEH